MSSGVTIKLFNMVKIISYKLSQNTDGKDFVSLKLQGGVEAIQSQQTGRFYLTAKTCYIPSTFDQATAEALIGSEMPGKVSRVESEAYEYTVKETGEVVTLTHRYEYRPEEVMAETAYSNARSSILDLAE